MSATIGTELKDSPAMNGLLDQMVAQVLAFSARIDGVRPPDPELAAGMRAAIQTVGEVRSRPLYYDFIGSGVGRGAYVELEDGSVKLDLINGIGIHLFGHSHPAVVRATLAGATSDVIHQGNLEPNAEYVNFMARMGRLGARHSRLRHVWLSTCGTMANENALKIARQKTGGRLILTFKNAFAGRSTMMAEITDNAAYRVGLPEYHEVLRLPFYDPAAPKDQTLRALNELVAQHGRQIACFAFEPMLGEGGYRAANHEFFRPLLEVCRAHQIPVWADEIQTFTRTGEFFAFETLGLGEYIDLCTVAKTAQNGVTLFTPEMKPDAGLLGGTFAGSTPALRAGDEMLRMLEEGNYLGPAGRVMDLHRRFKGMLDELNQTTCRGLLREAGGMGLMVAVTPLDGSKDMQGKLLKTLFKHGLICFGCGGNPYRIRFLLPVILTDEDIAVARQIIETSVLELA